VLLDPHERLRFMDYCCRQAESCRLIAEQFEKVGGFDAIARRERSKAAAYALVAMDLGSAVEEYTVGKEDVGDAL
jgi:hypothetical protein